MRFDYERTMAVFGQPASRGSVEHASQPRHVNTSRDARVLMAGDGMDVRDAGLPAHTVARG